jgi:hypothetical protein
MALINGMYLLVESEEPSYDVDVTEQPIEKGVSIIDHVQRRARTMAISGFIVGDDASEIRNYLLACQDSGSIVQFDGRNFFVGLLTGLQTKHDYSVGDGFSFTATLREVLVAESSFVETLPEPVRAQAAPVISSGRKQTKSTSSATVEKVAFVAGSPWAEG